MIPMRGDAGSREVGTRDSPRPDGDRLHRRQDDPDRSIWTRSPPPALVAEQTLQILRGRDQVSLDDGHTPLPATGSGG